MSDASPLLTAIHANPFDHQVRQAYADWVEGGHGDAGDRVRAELFRAAANIQDAPERRHRTTEILTEGWRDLFPLLGAAARQPSTPRLSSARVVVRDGVIQVCWERTTGVLIAPDRGGLVSGIRYRDGATFAECGPILEWDAVGHRHAPLSHPVVIAGESGSDYAVALLPSPRSGQNAEGWGESVWQEAVADESTMHSLGGSVKLWRTAEVTGAARKALSKRAWEAIRDAMTRVAAGWPSWRNPPASLAAAAKSKPADWNYEYDLHRR